MHTMILRCVTPAVPVPLRSNNSVKPQAEEMTMTVRLLVDRETGAGLSTLMKACLSVEKPNGTTGPIVLAAVIDVAPRKLAAPALPAAKPSPPVPTAVPAAKSWASVAAAGMPPAAAKQSEAPQQWRKTERKAGSKNVGRWRMVTEKESKNVEFLDHEGEQSNHRSEFDSLGGIRIFFLQ